MHKGYALLVVLYCCVFSAPSVAHQLSTAYLQLSSQTNHSNSFDGQLQLRLYDLERSVGLDTSGDGELRWHEVLERQSAIVSYIDQHLKIDSQATPCEIQPQYPLQFDSHFDQGFLVINFSAICVGDIKEQSLTVTYQGIFPQDPDHKLLLNIDGYSQHSAQNLSAVIDQQQQSKTFDPQQSYVWQTFSTYLYQGVVHILIGTDHILFLVVLLMSCVLYREGGTWYAQHRLVPVLKSAAWIVTAFTFAHSITLTATALNWISFNTRWVEVGIALSVLLTALNNLWPVLLRLGWITFAFGLLHGMGFASVLGELGLSSQHQIVSILAFNLGVELGQLLILLVALPLFYLCRNFHFYRWLILKMGSLVIGLIALNWAIQRL
ncbi:HupE/UreJ family protein [Aliiglaciecola litoralis]|uniref:HupE/UreJ family protein n=1 Tax=Aliiglaciecola litoralis TaxID=582857 RepID=A0ABN1LDM6_9ALTE